MNTDALEHSTGIGAIDAHPERAPHPMRAHVSDGERFVYGVGGSLLVAYGLRKGGAVGVTCTLLGSGLLYHGVRGRNPLYEVLNISTVRSTSGRQLIEVLKTMTINRPVEEVYNLWRDFQNTPRFMPHLQSVERLDERRSRWTVNGPAGATVTWEAEIVNEKPNELIAWQSMNDSDIRHWGVIRFTTAPGGRGTEVKIELEYQPIGGTLGTLVAKVFGADPAKLVEEGLKRFKQVMEAGEISTTRGQPRGR